MVVIPRVSLERNNWRSKSEENLAASLKLLLETKHLYQSATLDLDIRPRKKNARKWKSEITREKWGVRNNATSPSLEKPSYYFALRVPDVKLFCHQCGRVEAFNSISSQEFTGRSQEERNVKPTNDAIQVFVLSFLCQACKRVPEVFLMRREGLKLTLCGRAPMEVAEVPPTIPKTIRPYYSGALVAHQSGQTLAALFLLRTLIEQWARVQFKNPSPPRADKIMDTYMSLLPDDFKCRFPSLRCLYDDISADMHNAAGSCDLFDRALAEITQHFDARRLFKL